MCNNEVVTLSTEGIGMIGSGNENNSGFEKNKLKLSIMSTFSSFYLSHKYNLFRVEFS
jgi:hypothetical protein